jgi:hypothetical protein
MGQGGRRTMHARWMTIEAARLGDLGPDERKSQSAHLAQAPTLEGTRAARTRLLGAQP